VEDFPQIVLKILHGLGLAWDGGMMEFLEVVRRRRMVRRYAPDPVPADVLRRIVETARRGPSAGFTQGQSFVLVTDPDLRWEVAKLAGEGSYVARGFDPWISEAPALVVVCTSEQDYLDRYGSPDKLGPDGKLNWPVPFWYVDAGCSMMLLLLAAVDEGLAAGFLALREYDGLRALLGIPGDVQPIGIVTIGRAAQDRRSGSLERGRKPAAEVIHLDHWGPSA
jgi:nitroreductase